jgi:DNA primase
VSQEDDLLAVFQHYDIAEPGYGERSFRCPSHDDSRPSASVNRSEGVWFCHACGSGGTAAQIVMDKEGLNYVEATRFISNLTGGKTSSPPRRARKKSTRWIPPSLRRVTE